MYQRLISWQLTRDFGNQYNAIWTKVIQGPTIWNDLPARMKDPSLSLNSFRKLLKHSCLINNCYMSAFAVR